MSYEVFKLRVLGLIARADKTLKVGFEDDRDEDLYKGFSDGIIIMGNRETDCVTIKQGTRVFRTTWAALGFSE